MSISYFARVSKFSCKTINLFVAKAAEFPSRQKKKIFELKEEKSLNLKSLNLSKFPFLTFQHSVGLSII